MARPPHEPTERTRDLVQALVCNGVSQDRTARHLGIDVKTLKRWYRAELDHGLDSILADVTKNLCRIATSGDGMASVIAAKYVLGCRAGWREASPLDLFAKAQGTIQITISPEDANL